MGWSQVCFCLAAALMMVVSTPLAHASTCTQLSALTIPDVTVSAASEVSAGPVALPGLAQPLELPAFCRVEAIARPTPESEIHVEIWIPVQGAWNARFQGVGNGGYQGSIPYAAMAAALRRGYAVGGTDTGHVGEDLSFGIGHPERIRDWGWRAIHVTAQLGHLVVRNAAGRLPEHSYFVGCSTGGHQALSEVQRFPEDYDGVIVGDPGYDRIRQTAAYLHSWLATHDASGAPLLSSADLQMVTRRVIADCDGDDGVRDGVVDDPRRCAFNPAELACSSAAAHDCLSAAQIEALTQVYRGTYNPRTGEQIFPGWSLGSEGFGANAGQGWGAFILQPTAPMRVDVFRNFVFADPSWHYRSFDFDRDMSFAEDRIPDMAAVDPDIHRFRDRGGRLIMYAGWSDPVAAPLDVIKYYDAVSSRMGGQAATQSFFRFFMAPGMGHCGNGPGPNTFDMLSVLENWVEHGQAPERVIASHSENGAVTRTRPLCVYPQVARWNGHGNTNDASNFVCRAAQPSTRAVH